MISDLQRYRIKFNPEILELLKNQNESNNNLFIPIPSVCLTSYAILVASIKGLLKTGTYNAYINRLDQPLVDQIEYVKKELNIWLNS